MGGRRTDRGVSNADKQTRMRISKAGRKAMSKK